MTSESGKDEAQGLREEDWISAAATIARVRDATLSSTAHIALAKRAHAGLLRAHCELMIINDTQRYPDCDVPASFWWAEGHDALTQNWELGDFETWIKKTVQYQIFGVRFHREDVERVVGLSAVDRSRPEPSANRESGGRPMSELWPEWVAELAALIHEEGVPDGSGAMGSDDLIVRVADRLANRGLNPPARATLQETAKAVLRRLRAGN